MGVLSFISSLQNQALEKQLAKQQEQAALERQKLIGSQGLAEIEARKQAAIAQDVASREAANRQASDLNNRQGAAQMQQDILRKSDIAKSLVAAGVASPEESDWMAGVQMSQNRTEPDRAKTTSALRENAFNLGALPGEGVRGRTAIQSQTTGNVASEAENLNRYNVAREMAPLSSAVAQAQAQHQIAGAKLGTEEADITRTSGLPQTRAGTEKAGLNYKTKLIEATDPTIVGQAETAEAAGKGAVGDMLKSTGGIGVAPLNLTDSAIVDKTDPLIQRTTSGLNLGGNTSAYPSPGISGGPISVASRARGAIPGVTPQLNINMIREDPTSAVDPQMLELADAIRKNLQSGKTWNPGQPSDKKVNPNLNPDLYPYYTR